MSEKLSKESQYIVSCSKPVSDPPFGSDRESGCDSTGSVPTTHRHQVTQHKYIPDYLYNSAKEFYKNPFIQNTFTKNVTQGHMLASFAITVSSERRLPVHSLYLKGGPTTG